MPVGEGRARQASSSAASSAASKDCLGLLAPSALSMRSIGFALVALALASKPAEVHAQVAEVHSRPGGRRALVLGQDQRPHALGVDLFHLGRHALGREEPLESLDRTQAPTDSR